MLTVERVRSRFRRLNDRLNDGRNGAQDVFREVSPCAALHVQSKVVVTAQDCAPLTGPAT